MIRPSHRILVCLACLGLVAAIGHWDKAIAVAGANPSESGATWRKLFAVGPLPSPNSVVAVNVDFAALLAARGEQRPFNQYSLRVEATDATDAGRELPMRWEPRRSKTDGRYGSAGRLVFVVADPKTSRVAVEFGPNGPAPLEAPPVPIIGDGDLLRMAGVEKGVFHGVGSVPRVVDFDGDGRRDLLGFGWLGPGAPVVWFRNIGTDTQPVFSEREQFPLETVDGQPIGLPRYVWSGSIVPCDWDGDGRCDLLLSMSTSHDKSADTCKVIFYRNVGTGAAPAFAPGKQIFATQAYSKRETDFQIDVADWDGDGKLDLIYAVTPGFTKVSEAGLWFVKNVGRGPGGLPKLAQPVQIQAGGKPIDFLYFGAPSVADFDGDGLLDIMAGQYYEKPGPPAPGNPKGDIFGIYYFKNVGARTVPRLLSGVQLKDAHGRPVCRGFNSQPTMVDWNRDGRMDVLVTTGIGGKPAAVCLNDGSGKLRPPRTIPYRGLMPTMGPGGADFAAPVCVDLDGDGVLDLVVGDGEGRVLFYRGLGNLQYALPVMIRSQGKPIDEHGESDAGEAHRGYVKVLFADWNGDGLRDMIMWSMNGERGWLNGWKPDSYSLKFLPGTRDPLGFGPPQEIRADGKQIVAGWRCKPDVVDLDGDGLLDLVETIGHGQHEVDTFTVMFFKNVGTRSAWKLAAPVPLTRTGGRPVLPKADEGRRMCVRLADWDGDGKLDLFTARDWQAGMQCPGVRYWKNVGTKTKPVFADPKTFALVNQRVHSWHEVVVDVVDLDGDKTLDLVVGNGDRGTIHFFRHTFVESGYQTAQKP
jgi:hypothetical protein